MKKVLLKGLVTLLGVSGLFYVNSGIAFAEVDNNGSDLVEVIKEEETKTDDFNLEQPLQQIQTKIASKIKEILGIEVVDQLDSNYLNILQRLDTGELILGENDEENVTISEFAGIYINRIAAILPENATAEQLSVVNEERETLLARTFNDIKVENMSLIMEAENEKPTRMARAGFNVSKASSYARNWAYRRNMLFPTYSSDCTNFASQIAFYGGKPLRKSANASGMTWTHNGGVNSSSPWMRAHNFMVFWTADGYATRQFAKKADAQAYTREGDFVGYWKKNTYEITHIAYVNKKSGSTAYITQHSNDRKDEAWNSIDTNGYSSFIVLRF